MNTISKGHFRGTAAAGALMFPFLAAPLACRAQPDVAPQPIHLDANAPLLKTELATTPVRSSRVWGTGIAPNPRGGWNLITQHFPYHSNLTPEYSVVDLQTGKQTVTKGRPGGYTNTNYQADWEPRAANGRIFFSEAGCFVTYYDPKDEKIHDLGEVADPQTQTLIYRWYFGPDGKLYGGTQAKGNNLPVVVQIDPETLKYRTVAAVGKERNQPNYAYYMSVDPTPSPGAPQGWLYVAVGQNPWELAAVNIETGEQKILWKQYESWIDGFNALPSGLRTGLTTNFANGKPPKKDFFWVADGQMYPFDQAQADKPETLPFKPRTLKDVGSVGPVDGAPELDLSQLSADSNGIARVSWRPAGSKGDLKEVAFKVTNTVPVDLESLITLPDKTLLGNAVQYQGFFRYDPRTKSTTFFGAHGPSRGPRLVHDGRVYIVGYPKSVVYEYDPRKPWTSNRHTEEMLAAGTLDEKAAAALNPRKIGNFTGAETHYAYYLINSANGRMYFGGRRERDGTGGGVGWYDAKTNTFGGHHKDLGFLTPRGMVVLDDVGRVVYSGLLGDDPSQPGKKPAEAQLVVYDMELNELERLTVKPGMKSTGLLLNTPIENQIIGISEADNVLYRYDIAQKKLLDWRPLPEGGVGNDSFVRSEDGSWLGVLGNQLIRLDAKTVDIKSIGKFETPPSLLTWDGSDLYGVFGPEVRRVILRK